jgi:hypothetical protein
LMWNNTLTITPAPSSGSVAFNGTGSPIPGDSAVTVNVCADPTCSTSPILVLPNVPVDAATGTWRVSGPLQPGTYWAEATQTQSGQPQPVSTFTGSFVVP